MALIDSNGISIETVPEWKDILDAIYLGIDPEWKIDANTLDGQIIAAFAEILANADEAILDSYNAADPDKARGVALDALLALSNVSRRDATFSTAVVQLTGVASTVVPAGTKFENAVTGTKWSLDAQVVLTGGADNGNVTCDTEGAQTAGIGELSKIATPVSGLQSVNNSAAATVGQNEMTDPEARSFRLETLSNNASNVIDSITGAVALVENVTLVKGYNNRDSAADGNGIPGNSIAIIVQGGTDADVAAAIYSRLGPGVGMYGGTNTVTENVVSPNNNNDEDITFGRAGAVPLFITVNLIETGQFADSDLEAIKQAVVDFSLGNLFDNDPTAGNRKTPFQIGEDISSGLIHTPVNYIVGATGQGYVDSIFIDDAVSPSAAGTVAIDWESVATCDVANIVVNVT